MKKFEIIFKKKMLEKRRKWTKIFGEASSQSGLKLIIYIHIYLSYTKRSKTSKIYVLYGIFIT